MEKADRDLILALCPTHNKLRELYDEHIKLEKEVKKFEQYLSYSASVQLRQKQLKKAKLKGVDAMMEIISQYRRSQAEEAMH
jgi:hypothetical protein